MIGTFTATTCMKNSLQGALRVRTKIISITSILNLRMESRQEPQLVLQFWLDASWVQPSNPTAPNEK